MTLGDMLLCAGPQFTQLYSRGICPTMAVIVSAILIAAPPMHTALLFPQYFSLNHCTFSFFEA